MNRAQRMVTISAALLIVAMIVCPPWQSREGRYWAAYSYSWIFAPPNQVTETMSAAELGARAKSRLPGKYEDMSDEAMGRGLIAQGRSVVSMFTEYKDIRVDSVRSLVTMIAGRKDVRIDSVRLLMQTAALALLAGACIVGLRDSKWGS